MLEKINPKILLVEDDAIISKSQSRVIQDFGCRVTTAHTGREAIEKALDGEVFDLILMDIDLGEGMNGLEAARKILQKKNLPIVFLSSYSESEYKHLPESITGYGYVVKNSGDHLLKIAIEMALKLFKAHEETKQRELALLQSREELKKKNQQMEFLAELSLNIASKKHDENLPEFLCEQLKKSTGAAFISIQTYDESKSTLVTKKVLTDQKILNKMVNFYGKRFTGMESILSPAMYEEIVTTIVGVRKTLTETSFGKIPLAIDTLYKKLSGVDRYFGIAFLIDNKLYGTAVMGIVKASPNPSNKFLASFAHIAAVALKRKITEDQLKLSEKKYVNLINNLNDSIYTVDNEGILRFITSNIKNISGYSPQEIVGKKFADFIYSEDLPSLEEGFNNTLQGKIIPKEFRIISKNGNLIWVRSSSKPTFLEENKKYGLTGMLMDITKEKFAQEKIHNLLKEKVLILKEVHHRIKNNLIMVSSMLSIQSQKFNDQEVQKAFLDTAKRVQSMMVLYDRLYRDNNYLEFSVKSYFDSLINEMKKSYMAEKLIEINSTVDDAIIPVKILTNLGIILNELITNVIKHGTVASEKIIVNIELVKKENSYTLIFSDNGVNFPEELSFARSQSFGLQLVGLLVRQIGGKIGVDTADLPKIIINFQVN